MHKRLVEAIEIAGFYFHFIGEDSPDDGVSPLSSWQGPGHLFSIFPLHIDFSIDNQLDLVRPTWIEWPVCPSIFFVKFWRSSKSNGRWNSCVFSSNSSLILPPPFFLLYLGGISLPSSLYALFTGVCIWPGVCLFLFLFFFTTLSQECPMKLLRSFSRSEGQGTEKGKILFVFRGSDYCSAIFSWWRTLEISDDLIVK